MIRRSMVALPWLTIAVLGACLLDDVIERPVQPWWVNALFCVTTIGWSITARYFRRDAEQWHHWYDQATLRADRYRRSGQG